MSVTRPSSSWLIAVHAVTRSRGGPAGWTAPPRDVLRSDPIVIDQRIDLPQQAVRVVRPARIELPQFVLLGELARHHDVGAGEIGRLQPLGEIRIEVQRPEANGRIPVLGAPLQVRLERPRVEPVVGRKRQRAAVDEEVRGPGLEGQILRRGKTAACDGPVSARETGAAGDVSAAEAAWGCCARAGSPAPRCILRCGPR